MMQLVLNELHQRLEMVLWRQIAQRIKSSFLGILVIDEMQKQNKSREGANKRGNSSRLTQSFHFFMFEPIFSPVNALNQPI
jgi:hypothetical protein